MTIADLYQSVAQLGFETSLEDEARFVYAANRALLQVNSLRPATGIYMLNHAPLENKLVEDTFTPVEKVEDLCFEAVDAKTYYFEANGNGVVYVELYDEDSGVWAIIGVEEFAQSNSFSSRRGFIKRDGEFVNGRVRLRFTGPYLYSIRNVALYEHLYSDSVVDIPAFEPFSRYDISSLASDFLALDKPPMKEGDVEPRILNQDYGVENGRIILLPYNSKGLYKIVYQKHPGIIPYTGDAFENTTQLSLDDDLCALLPILVASYLWLEDEPEKAQFYFAIYQERAADISRKAGVIEPVLIKSVNGW